MARAPAPLKSSPEREIGGPETGFGETVRCGENPAVVEQRRAAVEALVAEWNPAEQHPAGNLSLQRHEPRPLALGETFPADQTLHDAMTAYAVALCGSACSSRTQCQLQQIVATALTLLVRRQEGHPACGYLSGVRCRLAYSPADATATHCLLLQ